jgi:prepilin-type N-terminal cleavage/methylation domain-containing protein
MQKLMKAFHKNQKGFTLVELMVVVVIIGVLVAIAFPVYNTITDAAAQNAHEANIRIIKGAIEMYKAANDGASPANLNALVTDFLEEIPAMPEHSGTLDPDMGAAYADGDFGL